MLTNTVLTLSILIVGIFEVSLSFSFSNIQTVTTGAKNYEYYHHPVSNTKKAPKVLWLSSLSPEEDEEDDEESEPGKMRISEIKAELKLRNTPFSDCFDKQSLTSRLIEARVSGKADPSLVDEFNKKKLEASVVEGKTLADSVKDEDIEKVLGNDGNLPGGMSPDMLKNLLGNPELVVLLQNVKMQEIMKLTMSGGQDAVQQAMEDDPETRELVMKLNKIMGSTMK